MRDNDSIQEVKQIFSTSTQEIIPVLNNENQVVGIIYLNAIRKVIFSDFQIKFTAFKEIIQEAPVNSVTENTGNIIKIMDETKNPFMLLTRENKYIGYIDKTAILEIYRENLKNLRIE